MPGKTRRRKSRPCSIEQIASQPVAMSQALAHTLDGRTSRLQRPSIPSALRYCILKIAAPRLDLIRVDSYPLAPLAREAFFLWLRERADQRCVRGHTPGPSAQPPSVRLGLGTPPSGPPRGGVLRDSGDLFQPRLHASHAFWNWAFASSKVAFVARSDRPHRSAERYQANPSASRRVSGIRPNSATVFGSVSPGVSRRGIRARRLVCRALRRSPPFGLSVRRGALAPPDAPCLVAS
jgi:hypothetical protein